MNTIETSHDPAEQVAIARQQGATADQPSLPPDEGHGDHDRHRRWLSGVNLAVGMVLGVVLAAGVRFLQNRR